MEKILYLSSASDSVMRMSEINKKFLIQPVSSLRDVLIYLLDNPDVSLFLNDVDPSHEVNRKLLEVIRHLNPLLPYIFINQEGIEVNMEQLRKYNENAVVATSEKEILEQIEKAHKNRRQFNRVVWPLSTSFYHQDNPDRSDNGLVLSLSAGGAFIKTTSFGLLENFIDKEIIMEIKFDVFKFMVEAQVLRLQKESDKDMPLGFAVQFVRVSDATKNYIKRIINDRIMLSLMEELNLSPEYDL